MNRGLKPVSRLTIVFILAVLLSGSVLAWFSINNISNLKELTEKRILEEQRVLSERVLKAISAMLEDVIAGLSVGNVPLASFREDLEKRADEFDFVTQSFILLNNRQFFYPNFINAPLPATDNKPSATFYSSFTAGEAAEFAEHDLLKARSHYLAGLKYASGEFDTARSLNALGRVAVKITDYENAITLYSRIIKDYPGVTDANGMPYSLYALQQLLRIADQNNFGKTVPAVRLCLEKMADGIIPLTHGTDELLELIAGYLDKNDSGNQDERARMASFLENLKEQSRLMTTYGDELRELVEKRNLDEYPSAGNGFVLADPASGLVNEFFLVNAAGENHLGFLIDSEKLLDTVMATELQSGLEFDYIINFPASFNREIAADDRLIYRSQLNPFFPGQLMVIKMSDKTLISDIVRRRGLIYGIASVMLLVAMLLGVALILRDISREKHLARLRADFISNVTHELKTPLTSIRMYAESLILGRVKSPEEQKEYLSVLVSETDRLKRMINNILEFSKTAKQKQDYHPVETSLADVLQEAVNDMNYWIEEKRFELVTDIDQDITVRVDAEKFRQVYTNLLNNAIKYSGDARKITIRLFRKADTVITEVEDEGIGIASENLSRIFEEFYRVEQQGSGNIAGTGLGLTVAREIVEGHGGKITVESEIGKGSRFSVILYQQ